MPQRLMIAPGEADIGTATIGGKDYVRVVLPDTDSGDVVELTFGVEHFVTFADHLRMVADTLVKAQPPKRPPFR